jgi:hypothetical protein
LGGAEEGEEVEDSLHNDAMVGVSENPLRNRPSRPAKILGNSGVRCCTQTLVTRGTYRAAGRRRRGASGALPEGGSTRGACTLPTVSSPAIVCRVPALRATQREELLIVTRPCCQVGVETLRQLPCLTAHVV